MAYADLKDEKHYVWISQEGTEAMRVMQLGLQYMLHIQKKVVQKV